MWCGCAALDNMIARQYTDSQCVLHERPLFESGTLGTQANSVIVLPHKTSSYGEGAQAGEGQGIAKCTLQNFPALPLHCIEWAREMFDENFIDGAQKCLDFLEVCHSSPVHPPTAAHCSNPKPACVAM
jgi:hypothetical protein